MEKQKKQKKGISLRHILLFDAIALIIIGFFLFVVETKVTEYKQNENLTERLKSVQSTFDKAYEETREVTELYDLSIQAKADSLAFLADHEPGFRITAELREIYDADGIYIGNVHLEQGYRYYSAYTADGRKITVEKLPYELNAILDNIYTDNRILNRIVELDDLFVIITTRTGEIVYYPEEEFIGRRISSLGISLSDLTPLKSKWLKINGDRYYASSVDNSNLGITVICGIPSARMTRNSYTVVFFIFFYISIILAIVTTYTYFTKQQARSGDGGGTYTRDAILKKMGMFTLLGLLLIGLVTYYIQSLFYLSLHSLGVSNEIDEIVTSSAEARNGAEKLTEQYNASYLSKAQITSHILSEHPELRNKKDLKTLSDIFDFEFIMMFDREGVETLSDSYIVGFVISDDPEDQSYAFNLLKNGIPYVVQEAQEDELTGTYRQYIGVLTYDTEGEMDGFLQVAVSPDKLEAVLSEAQLETVLDNAVAGTDDDVFVVDPETGKITYDINGELTGKLARQVGFKEEQLRSGFMGSISVRGTKYYLESFDQDGLLIYIGDTVDKIFSGRLLLTLLAVAAGLLSLVIFFRTMKGRPVKAAEEVDRDLYVDVPTADGEIKQSINIIARVMRQRIHWNDKTPEAKTSFVVKVLLNVFAFIFLILYAFRDRFYTSDSIFGFIVSDRWEKGLNVFALTKAFIFIGIFTLIMTMVDGLLTEVIKMVSPRSETSIRLIRSFSRYVLTLGMIFYVLTLFGFDSQSLLVSAGLLTLVVGLGAQNLITDIISGLFIIFEDEFQVGDIIEVGGYKGRVVEIGIRSTRLMSGTQDVKTINNRDLANIINKTRNTSFCDVIINVPFTEDMSAVEKLLNEILPKVKDLSPYIISGPTYGGIDDMSAGKVKLSIRTECLEAHKFDVRTVVHKAIIDAFEKNGIQLC